MSDAIEIAVLDAGDEHLPLVAAECRERAIRIDRTADQDGLASRADLNALTVIASPAACHEISSDSPPIIFLCS
jgi:hypothetical protein